MLIALLALAQGGVAAGPVHSAPATTCAAEAAVEQHLHHDHVTKSASADRPCQEPSSEAHHHHSNSDGNDCCVQDCECSFSHCTAPGASAQPGLSSYPWRPAQGFAYRNMQLRPSLSSFFRPPILA